ncbi:hypothetical protein PMJ46TS7_11860 [Paenibacillus melissococcoides]
MRILLKEQVSKTKDSASTKRITHLSNKSTTKASHTVNQLNKNLLKYISNR